MNNMKKEEPEELSDAWMLNWTNEEDIKPLDIKPEIIDKLTPSHESDLKTYEVDDIKQEKSDSLTKAENTKILLSTYPFQLKELRVRLKKLDHHYMEHQNEFSKTENNSSKNRKGRPNHHYGRVEGIGYLDFVMQKTQHLINI